MHIGTNPPKTKNKKEKGKPTIIFDIDLNLQNKFLMISGTTNYGHAPQPIGIAGSREPF